MTVEKKVHGEGPAHFELELKERDVSALFWLLQSGFIISGVEVGCSVKSFLTSRLGMSAEFIREYISTIFLDGKPVDDSDTAVMRDGSRLALSSALPGLVGATMRSGGALASLRSSITYKDTGICSGGSGTVHVKLFNMVMEAAGPHLLREGILVPGEDLETFLKRNSDLIEACHGGSLDNQTIPARDLLEKNYFAKDDLVLLSVKKC